MSSLVETPEYVAFRRFVDLTVEKRELSARLDELNAQLKAMQPALLSYLSASNMRAWSIDNFTVSPRREPWVYPITGVSKQQVCETLKLAGLGGMVKESYHHESLKSYFNQLEARAQLIAPEIEIDGPEWGEALLRAGLHPALADILSVKAAFSLQVRRKENRHARSQNQRQRPQGDEDEPPDE